MPLTEMWPKAVRLIVVPGIAHHEHIRVPVGTGFIVAMDSEEFGSNLQHQYLVTAGHVVQGARESYARTRLFGDKLRDERIPDWVFHPAYDVAVAPYIDREDIDGASVKVETFTDEAELGDSVFFLGLLRKIDAMGDEGIPMVRSGSVGRMWQQGIPATMPGGVETSLTGHLIDCRAYQGMSGSPCFRQRLYVLFKEYQPILRYVTNFLGMIAAHFDDTEDATVSPADIGVEVKAKMHTGVGIVTPAAFIRETLELEEFVTLRREADAREAQRRSAEHLTTTLDADTSENAGD